MKQFLPPLTPRQVLETGMLVALSCLGWGWLRADVRAYPLAMGALLLNLLVPGVYYPLAVGWFGLANLLSKISTALLLSVLFVGLVVPVALLKRWFGQDTMQRRNFKNGQLTAWKIRQHCFQPTDFQHPF